MQFMERVAANITRWLPGREANWKLIRKLLSEIGIPTYLATIIDSYLQEQRLWFDTNNGLQEYIVSAGVSQSVLSPLLWKIMHNDVFNPSIPEQITLVVYADDIAVVVITKLERW